MSFRATAALALIALALGLYVYFVEIRGERERKEAEAVAKRLLSVEPDEITALEITTTDRQVARLVRASEADEWRLESPVTFPADQAFVSDLLATLGRLKAESVIENPPEDLKPFGLDEARNTVRVWTSGEEPTSLYLGGTAPIGSAVYLALEGEPEQLFTVAQAQTTGLKPRLFELRNKRMVDFEPEDVSRLRVAEFGTQVAAVERIESEEPTWRLTEPREDRGDSERIERLLQDLVVARATGFVDELGPLAEYGLDRPEVEITVETPDGLQNIQIGRIQDKAFLRVGDAGIVYQTSDRLVMGVPRRTFAFRHKQVLKLDEDRVASIELDFPRDNASYTFLREDHVWKAEDAELRVKSLGVEDLLWAIQDLEATDIEEGGQTLAQLGLEPPRVRVRAFDEEGEELGWLELGDPAKTAENIAARSSESDRLWRVQKELGDDVPLGSEAFERILLETPPS